jgi:hypothetical protein
MQELASSCLDEHALLALASGNLQAERLPAAEAHLARCISCQRMVAEIAASLTDVADSGLRTARQPELEGDAELPSQGEVIDGRYRVERWLGRGGMGSVCAAIHLGLEQRVAIKLLRLHEPEAASRFVREGRTLARLCDEHIVRVYDSGELPSGTPYIVMEHLEGSDLSELCKAGPLAIDEVIGYVRQACLALESAHSAGIVHRDLKPSNLFLTKRNGVPIVKVLDFGISKRLRASRDSAGTLTGVGDMIGSPRYMSPEQVHASPEIDRRADIWSLGVILYELLTGRAPFAQPQIVALAIAIATENPVPPRALQPELPVGLEAIIMRCLEKVPARRFESAAQLSAALAPFEITLGQSPQRRAVWVLAGLVCAAAFASWAMHAPSRPEPAMQQLAAPQPTAAAVSPEPAPTLPALAPAPAEPVRKAPAPQRRVTVKAKRTPEPEALPVHPVARPIGLATSPD